MLLKINCAVYLEVKDDADPEEVAQDFESGFNDAIMGFDGYSDKYDPQVEKGVVKEINLVGDEERDREGLTPE